MLGYTAANNDVTIFLEQVEIERLQSEKLRGFYFTHDPGSQQLPLDLSVNAEFFKHQQGQVVLRQTDDLVSAFVRPDLYDRLRKSGAVRLHEGYRKVNLLSLGVLGILEAHNYAVLRQRITASHTPSAE